MKQVLVTALGALCILTLSVAPTFAKYPEKNITMIVPYAAGGATDIVARALAAPLSKELGVTVVIKNTTGAGGIIGSAELAKAKPDGYTIGYMPIGPVTLQQYQRALPYDDSSFEYIGLVYDYYMTLMSGTNVPWTDYQTMREEVLKNPGKYLYGSPGVGAMPHIASAFFFKAMGAEVRHMPSTDAASVYAAIAGGTVQFYSNLPGEAKMQGFLPLVVAGPERVAEFPNLPTAREVGLDVPDIMVWNGIMAPKGIAPEALAVLDAAVGRAVNSPEFAAAGKHMDYVPHHMNAADFAQYVRQATQTMQQVMTALGFSKQ